MWSLSLSSTAVNNSAQNVHRRATYLTKKKEKAKIIYYIQMSRLRARATRHLRGKVNETRATRSIFSLLHIARSLAPLASAVGGHLAILRYYHYKWLPTTGERRMETREKGNFTCERTPRREILNKIKKQLSSSSSS
jgi:hypothetical protein